MRCVLVHSPPHGEVPFRHLGLGYLQATLLEAGIEAETLDLSLREDQARTDFYQDYIYFLSASVGEVGDGTNPRILLEVMRPELFSELLPISRKILARVEANLAGARDAGDVFLFTLNTLTQYFAAGLAIRLRAAGKKTVAGGPIMRSEPLRRLLLLSGAFDAVVEGEGEGVIAGLVRDLSSGPPRTGPGISIPGEHGSIVSQPPSPFVDLDALPRPDFGGTTVRDFIPIGASRGCPHKCSFCSERCYWPSYRLRDPALVVEEMERTSAMYRCTNFHFHDDQINGSPRWIDQFAELLGQRKARYRWESFCGPEGLDAGRLARMRAAGCVLLKLGIQSFSPRVLQRMRRGQNADALAATIVAAVRAGIAMHYDMLTCFPGETEEDHQASLRMVERIYSVSRDVHFSPNPFYLSSGSETMTDCASYGITLRSYDPSPLPSPAAELVRTAGEFPVAFSYGIDRETVGRRLADYGAILRKYNKDYQYLGKQKA